MNKLQTVIAIALVALPLVVPHTAAAVENDPGMWTVFSTTDVIQSDGEPTRWHYWFDGQARYFDIGSGSNQWLARPAVGYEIRDGVRVWLGYGRFRSRNGSGGVADENRLFQQVDWRMGEWAGGNVSIRARLLQRSASTGDDLGLLFRFMTKYTRPLGNDRTFVVALEPFFDLKETDWGGRSGLRQNRLFVGSGWKMSERWSLEAGYMNQYLVIDNADNVSNHLAVFNFRVKL